MRRLTHSYGMSAALLRTAARRVDHWNRTMPSRQVSFLEVFGFVWSYWRRQPWQFGVIATGVCLGVAVEAQIPRLSADLVAAIRVPGEGSSAWPFVGRLLGAFALVSLLQQGYLRVWNYFASKVMQGLVMDGFRTVQRFSADWHANSFSGATVRKISRGMWAYDQFADAAVVDLGPAFLLLIALSAAMFLHEPAMGLYFAVAVSVFVALSIWLSLAWVAPANRAANEADTEMGGALADSVTCNPVVKAFGAEAREDDRLHGVTWTWRRRARAAWTRSMDAGAAQSVAIVCLLGGLLALALGLSGDGPEALDTVVYVVATYFVVNGYLRNIGWQVRSLQQAVNELDDLVAIAKTPPQVADAPDAVQFAPGPGAIAFEDVRFHYGSHATPLFDGFGVYIEAGEKVALVGESGSGKTTFVKLLQRLYDVNAGRIMVDGQCIAEVTQDSLRQAMALVPQEPILFHRSLAENIAYGRPDASREAVVEAAKKAYAHEFISRLRAGYDTLVGERGVKLSGGERQRIAIARAILADAPILILDEATSSLDSVTEQLIQQGVSHLMEGRTSIVVAHRLSTVREADRILVFDRGRIVEEGTHDNLMARPGGVYRRLYSMQSLGFVASEPEQVA